jgi:hypothetical protein
MKFVPVLAFAAIAIAATLHPAFGQENLGGAYSACQEVVGRALKNPGSAQFPALSKVQAKYIGGGEYLVIGFVDSENDFSALKRTSYECKIADWSSEWKPLRLVVAGRTVFNK